MDITIHLDTSIPEDLAALLRLLQADEACPPAACEPEKAEPKAPAKKTPAKKTRVTKTRELPAQAPTEDVFTEEPAPEQDLRDTPEEAAAEREAIQLEAEGKLWVADDVRVALMEVVAKHDQAAAQAILREVGKVERLRELAEGLFGAVIRAAKEKVNAA